MKTHCSVTLLESALAGQLPAADETILHEHLESCDQCNEALERMAGGAGWCREAASLLAEDELDAAVPTRDEWSEIDFTVEHLEPTDEPGVLGRLGGYDVLEIIGHGGMGVVLKAFDRELKRTVAIKVLAPHLARNSLARKRFAREAQAAAAVVHPHVLAIHQVQAGGRLPFLVMPLVAGESLAERLTAQGALELKEVLRIGMQAAAGLAAAHEQGLVHRDVKPANILLEKGVERAVLTDFGLARAADDVTLTRWGIVAGTPQYMSPEQARGEPLDGRSDLFSLGCVLYEMATGVSPFRTDSMLATMRRLVDDSPQAMASLNPELPPWFIAIVERLLQKDPARRFNSAAEVSDLLESCLAHVQRPAAVPLPDELSLPKYQPDRASGRFGQKPSRRAGSASRLIFSRPKLKLLAAAAAALAFILAGVVIVLETKKGTLTIESDADVALRITQGDKIVEELTVTQGSKNVRIAAGTYVVEIDGKADGIAVTDGNVTIERGGNDIVTIVRRDAAHGGNAMPRPTFETFLVEVEARHGKEYSLAERQGWWEQWLPRLLKELNGTKEPDRRRSIASSAIGIANALEDSQYSAWLLSELVELSRTEKEAARWQAELDGLHNRLRGELTDTVLEWIGLHLQPITKDRFQEKNVFADYPGGMDVTFVQSHGPAEQAGIHEVDIVVRLQGRETPTRQALDFAMDGAVEQLLPKDAQEHSLQFDVLRSGETVRVNVPFPAHELRSFGRAERIAKSVAARIVELKSKYPHLKNFSAAEHLRENVVKMDFLPGTVSNPELYSISYHNGATRRPPPSTPGPRRAAEYDYDPKEGIRLNIHVFKGRSRGNDLSAPYQIGDLSVHVHVNGPAAEPIRSEIIRYLESMGAKLGPPAYSPEAPAEPPRPAHPPTSSGDGNPLSLPSSAPDASPTVPGPRPANNAAGEPSRDPPAPTPPTAAAADPPPSNDPQANSTGFSQTKELVLSMNSMKFMLDLDTGETMDPPARIRPEQAKMDVSTTQVQPYHYPTGLVGHSLQGKEVKPSDWNASVADVRRALAGNIYLLKEMDVGPEKTATYFFKTRDGALGILQFVGVTDEPKGIRLRYKTVLTSSAAKKSAPQNELLASMQGDWIVEKMTKGRDDALSLVADRRCQITVKDDLLTFLYHLAEKPDTLLTNPVRVERVENSSAVLVPLGIESGGRDLGLPVLLECDARVLRLCMNIQPGRAERFEQPPALAPGENVMYYECRRRTEDDFDLSTDETPNPKAPSTSAKPPQDAPPPLPKASAIELRLGYRETRPGLIEMNVIGGDEKVYVAPDAIATNDEIASAEVIDDSIGQPAIQFIFKEEAAKRLGAATEQHRDKPLAILVDGKVLTAPIVRDALGSKAMISGKFSREEAMRIVSFVSAMPKRLNYFTTGNDVHVACSADGKRIAVANGNPTRTLQTSGTSRVQGDWKPAADILDAETGKLLVSLKLTTNDEAAVLAATQRISHIEATALAFSPVEDVVAVGTSIGQVKLFNSRTGELLQTLDDEKARTADKDTPEHWKTLKRAMGSVASLAFSPDGSLLAVCGGSYREFSDMFDGVARLGRSDSVTGPGRLKVWEVKTGALKHDLVGHGGQANAVAFSPDGTLLASAGSWLASDGSGHGTGVIIWNPQTGEKLRTIASGANGGTFAVAFSPNSKMVVIGSHDYDKEGHRSATTFSVNYVLSGITEWKQTVLGWAGPKAFSPDGTSVLVVSRQSIQFLDTATGTVKREIKSENLSGGGRWQDFAVATKVGKIAIGAVDGEEGSVEVWEFDRADSVPGAEDNRSAASHQ